MIEEPTAQEFAAWYDLRVRLADDDHYGHVNNARYYEYFDSAVNGWLIDSMGMSVRDLPALGVVVANSCRYFRELHFPSRLRVGIRPAKIGTSSVAYRMGIFRQEDDGSLTPSAASEFVHVYVDPLTRRPTRIPDQVRKVLDELAPTP